MTTKTKRPPFLQVLIPILIALLILLAVLAALAALLRLQQVLPELTSPTANAGHTAGGAESPDEPTVQTTLPAPTARLYGPEDFGYIDGYMACLSGPYSLGVDVSAWQGTIDWSQVRQAGMEFAMLRLGYRGTDLGGMYPDECVEANYKGATEAGLQVGGYFFSQAITPEEAREEARFVLELVKDWDIQMPIVYDWEYMGADARTANVDGRTLTDCTIAFCEEIQAAGYTPMVYFNPDLESKQMFLGELTDYKFWLAMYSDQMTYHYRVDMWQYTSQGSVPGIDGNCDINLLLHYDD